jgi:hypothetical protein
VFGNVPPTTSGRVEGVLSEREEVVTALLQAFAAATGLLNERTAELRQQTGWSSVTSEFEVSEWRHDIEGSKTSLGFWGYVDGERADVGGVGWTFELVRNGPGWTVERSLNLNANTTDYQEAVAELPVVECSDSQELAQRLVELLRELLALPAPEPPSSTGSGKSA